MSYDLSKMDNLTFEHISQSLFQSICGLTCKIYGQGRDGKREAVYDSKATIDVCGKKARGRTFMQAKHKNAQTTTKDLTWLKNELKNEMDGLLSIKNDDPSYLPTNYFLFTNIKLTAVKDAGMKDKIDAYAKTFKHIVPNIHVVGYDEICSLIDNNSDVRQAYFSFLTSGDILSKLYESLVHKQEKKQRKMHDDILRFLDHEFANEMHSRLKEAGDLTDSQIPLEKVFIDLEASPIGMSDKETVNFIKHMIEVGNQPLTEQEQTSSIENFKSVRRCVLLGDAGQGKSTIGQYLAQIYRAFSLKLDAKSKNSTALDSFLDTFKKDFGDPIACMRIPIRVVLKDYAAWINNVIKTGETACNVLDYLISEIYKRTSTRIHVDDLYAFLGSRSWVFIFDGLDEVPSTSNRADVMRRIYSFTDTDLRRNNIDALILATSRQQDYHKDFPEAQYRHFRLQEMSDDICLRYVTKLIGQIEPNKTEHEQMLSVLKAGLEDGTVSKLMRRPLHASIVAILVRNGGRPPQDKYALFKEYIEVSINRERQKNIFKALIDYQDIILRIHENAAFILQSSSSHADNAAAVLHERGLTSIIESKISKLGRPKEEMDAVAKALFGVVRRLAFLSDNTDETFAFTIRSVQEYFAARYLIIDKEYDDIVCSIEKIAASAYWRNVVVFAVSYFVKEREKLAKHIVSICTELNGGSLSPLEYDVNKGAKMGSRLAFDLLCENIFSTNVGMENQYLNHLQEILPLSFAEPVSEKISTLPIAVLQRFICNHLHPYMKQYPGSETAWRMLWAAYRKTEHTVSEVATDILSSHSVNINMVLSFKNEEKIDEWFFPFITQWLLNGNIIVDACILEINVKRLVDISASGEDAHMLTAMLLKSGLLFHNSSLMYVSESWFADNFTINPTYLLYGDSLLLNVGAISIYDTHIVMKPKYIEELKAINIVCHNLNLCFFEKLTSYLLNPSKKLLLELVQAYYQEDESVKHALEEYFRIPISLRIIWNDFLSKGACEEEAVNYINNDFDAKAQTIIEAHKSMHSSPGAPKYTNEADFWSYLNYSFSIRPDAHEIFIRDFEVTSHGIQTYDIEFLQIFLTVILFAYEDYPEETKAKLMANDGGMEIVDASFKRIQCSHIVVNGSWKHYMRKAFVTHYLAIHSKEQLPNYPYHEFESFEHDNESYHRNTRADICNELVMKINKYVNFIEKEHNTLKIIPDILTRVAVDKKEICHESLKGFTCINPYNELGRLLLCLIKESDDMSCDFIKLGSHIDISCVAVVVAETAINNNLHSDTTKKLVSNLYENITASPSRSKSANTAISKLEEAMFEMASNVVCDYIE